MKTANSKKLLCVFFVWFSWV